MITNTTSRNLESKKKRAAAAAITVALVAAPLTQDFSTRYYNKTPKNTSKLTGQQWLNELLTGHHQRFYNRMGMNKHIFQALLRKLIRHGLHDTRQKFVLANLASSTLWLEHALKKVHTQVPVGVINMNRGHTRPILGKNPYRSLWVAHIWTK